MLVAGLTHAANALREAGNRVVGLPEAGGTLAGSRRPKKLRMRVAILRDENGKPVATPEDVEPSLAEARRVLREALAIDLMASAEPLVRTVAEPARRRARLALRGGLLSGGLRPGRRLLPPPS